MTKSFSALVQSAFRFLEEEFGFVVTRVDEDEHRRFFGSYVEYASPHSIVGLTLDRGIVSIPEISRVADVDRFKATGRISLDRILEYSTSTPEDLARLASRDFEEIKKAWEVVVAENQRRRHRLMSNVGSRLSDSEVDRRLARYASLLKEYGEPFLRGDFSTWLSLHEYYWHWLIAHEIVHDMRWGEDLTFENIEKRFSNVREYLHALRKEYGRE